MNTVIQCVNDFCKEVEEERIRRTVHDPEEQDTTPKKKKGKTLPDLVGDSSDDDIQDISEAFTMPLDNIKGVLRKNGGKKTKKRGKGAATKDKEAAKDHLLGFYSNATTYSERAQHFVRKCGADCFGIVETHLVSTKMNREAATLSKDG